MEKIFIRNLSVCTIIGTLDHERTHRQRVIFDLELCCNGKAAEVSDDIFRAVDYSAVEKIVVETAENSSFFLLEALTGAVGKAVVALPGVVSCKVTVSKPAASAYGALIGYQSEFFAEQ